MSRFLHTMIRVGDLERSIKFYTELLGMKELRRRDVPDGKYTLVIPGSGRSLTSFIYVALKPAADASGTLDGKTVTLKHYQLQFYKGMGDLYTDPDGNLMQADIPTLSASYIRVKFSLAAQ